MVINRLSTKYLVVFLFVFFIPFTIMIFITINKMDRIYTNEMRKICNSITQEIQQRIIELSDTADRISRFFIFSDMVQDYIKSENNNNDMLYNTRQISEYLIYDLITNDIIESIMILKNNKILISEGEVYKNSNGIIYQITGDDTDIHWSEGYKGKGGIGREDFVFNIERMIPNRKDMYNTIGSMIIQIKVESFFDFIDRNIYPHFLTVRLVKEDGRILLARDPEAMGTFIQQPRLNAALKSTETNSNIGIEQNSTIIQIRKLDFDDLFLLAEIDQGLLFSEMNSLKTIFFIDTGIVALFGFILLILLYVSIIKRIIRLSHDMTSVTEKNLVISRREESTDEIGQLQRDFSQMMQRIQDHIDIEWKLKLSQRESELKALQSQMDPHFLYNTLDMIRWNARLEGAYSTGDMIEQLSRIFRICVDNSSIWITVDKEKEYLESYVNLIKKRLHNRINLDISYDEDLGSLLIMKQLIQPLIENSIKHGLTDTSDHLHITVSLQIVQGLLNIVIEDNGKGIEDYEKLTKGALRNIEERVTIKFEDGCGLYYDGQRRGTQFTLILPVIDDIPEADDGETHGEPAHR